MGRGKRFLREEKRRIRNPSPLGGEGGVRGHIIKNNYAKISFH
jgi:hypothetical protein